MSLEILFNLKLTHGSHMAHIWLEEKKKKINNSPEAFIFANGSRIVPRWDLAGLNLHPKPQGKQTEERGSLFPASS